MISSMVNMDLAVDLGETEHLNIPNGDKRHSMGICGSYGVNHADLNENDFVCIDVSGNRFYTLKCTLEKYPETMLGNKDRRKKHFVDYRNALFFDRNTDAFTAILYYYQSGGILIRPPNIPMEMFAREITFFDLGEEVKLALKEKEGYLYDEPELPDKAWKKAIWALFEFPDSSLWARILSSFSIFVILVSIVLFCMETMPMFQIQYPPEPLNKTGQTNQTTETKNKRRMALQPWYSLEMTCIVWFSFEYIMRFISSPNRCQFVKSFLNMIDLLAILPYFIQMFIKSDESTQPLSVLRIVRLVRVFRIFKLSRYSMGMRILGHTLKASISELCMLIFFLMIGVVLFSSAIYYAEEGEKEGPDGTMFTSIPESFWYTLVTMTTVGYGDMTPKTLLGKIIGSMCAVTGVLTIALPVPVIASNFVFFYKRDTHQYEEEVLPPETPEATPETIKKHLDNNDHLRGN